MDVKIEDIDTENKRISLSLAGDEPQADTTDTDGTDDYRKYVEQPSRPETSGTGTLGDILKARFKEKAEKE